MARQFSFTSNYRKTFLGMMALGVVLLLVGYLMSNVDTGHGAHGDGHEGTHEKAAGQDAEHHSTASTAETVKFASSGHEAAPAAHDAKSDFSSLEKLKGENIAKDNFKTVLRAPVQEGQYHEAPHEEHTAGFAEKFGSVLLLGNFWWLVVALFGIFIIAVSYAANAGWYVAFKRVLESYYMYIPVGLVLGLVVFFGFGQSVYHWMDQRLIDPASPFYDKIIAGKSGFLGIKFILISIGLVGVWFFFGHRLRSFSLAEENAPKGDLTYHNKSRNTSAIFLPIFAFSFVLTAFLWLMSLEPHWFSTIFGVYCFAGMFVSGMIVTQFIVLHLKQNDFLPEVNDEHIHDISKFMFAFSVFWAYIWTSQYLLIWYANMPEETFYYYNRGMDYGFLFGLNVVLNFFFPFLFLMMRKSKRNYPTLKTVMAVMLFGRFTDLFLIVMPGIMGGDWNMGVMIMGIGMMTLLGGVFLYLAFSQMAKVPLSAKNHPYYKESIHHDVGV